MIVPPVPNMLRNFAIIKHSVSDESRAFQVWQMLHFDISAEKVMKSSIWWCIACFYCWSPSNFFPVSSQQLQRMTISAYCFWIYCFWTPLTFWTSLPPCLVLRPSAIWWSCVWNWIFSHTSLQTTGYLQEVHLLSTYVYIHPLLLWASTCLWTAPSPLQLQIHL